jgi:hypothetical protein
LLRRQVHVPALARFLVPVALTVVLFPAGACRRDRRVTFAPAPGAATRPVVINRSIKLTSIETDTDDGRGGRARVACVTCHALRNPGALPTRTADLKEFHVGLTFAHGELPCADCHVQGRVDVVHLADGTLVPMPEALRLCSQCHGPQARDYRHGAHGGMTGYWDRSAGPRLRNNCVDCHDPHAPRYPGARPAPGPRDRGYTPVRHEGTHA